MIKMIDMKQVIDPPDRPQSRPVVITIFLQVVRPSVRHKIKNLSKITTGRDCELAE